MNLGSTMRWGNSTLQLNGNAYSYFPSDRLNNLKSLTFEASIFSTSANGAILFNGGGTIVPFEFTILDGYLYGGVLNDAKIWNQLKSSEPLSLNEWHQVALSFDSTNKLFRLFQDGKEVARATVQGVPYPVIKLHTRIGAAVNFNGQNVNFFSGQIARIAIWSSARDYFQTVEDAVAIAPPSAKTPNLILWVDYTEMPTEDRSGNAIPITSGENHEPNYIYSVPSVKVTQQGVIDCGAYPEYNFAGNLPYTIEGWFNPSASADLSVILAFEKEAQWQYYLNYDKPNNTIIAKRNSDGQAIYSYEQITEGGFYHFAISYNSETKIMTLYVNGNLQTAEYFPSPVVAIDGGKLFIGGSGFTGFFQNVRLWKVCLDQAELRQWMLNDVITDPRLVANFDFVSDPPNDAMGHVIELLDGTANALATTVISQEERKAQLGITMPINSAYFNSKEEAPRPHPKGIHFADQARPFSEVHKEKTFAGLVSFLKMDQKKQAAFREVFDKAYAQAGEKYAANANLRKVFTRTDEGGRTKLIYHSLHGDTCFYDRPIGEVSDCTIWWISFIFEITVGFFGIFLPLPTFSAINQVSTKIYNLVVANAKVIAKITAVVGGTIVVGSALDIITEIHREKILWPILKFALTSAGWFVLTRLLIRAIALATGTVAAEILAEFLVWAAQMTELSLEYKGSCAQLAENA